MTYSLLIGDRLYSSWSLRGWLMLEKFDLPCTCRKVGLYDGTLAEDLQNFTPARTVPLMVTPEGYLLTDSLAMAETLIERHPDLDLLPKDGRARALARSMIAEMHSSFMALREDCPMMIAHAWKGFEASPAVEEDIARISDLWRHARQLAERDGPWLFGSYSMADVFYAPVATRIATYDLSQDADVIAYVRTHLSDPAFRRWRAMGLAERPVQSAHRKDLPQADWPYTAGPLPTAVDVGPAENDLCPYSNEPVTHFLSWNGQVFGFCNAFCRDKTIADPTAWPQFQALMGR